MKKNLIIIISVFIVGLIFGHASIQAYEIWFSGGFSSTPTYVYCSYEFGGETINAVHNACVTWNNAGVGNLVYRSTSTHTTTAYPCANNRNEITKGNRGKNSYLMEADATRIDSVTDALKEVDIDINIYYPFGTANTSYDTRTIITHELGHLLGLDHSDENRNNIMYPDRNPGERVHTLSSDDIAGINSLY